MYRYTQHARVAAAEVDVALVPSSPHDHDCQLVDDVDDPLLQHESALRRREARHQAGGSATRHGPPQRWCFFAALRPAATPALALL
jgi:hypothetical protein